MSKSARTLRCAVYTRKSSEEGLEQDFNSLHAQREACSAYIASQRHEGWVALPDAYDDGGFSGGTMERPGLQRLLADIALGKIDVVVVYKVDRLTRALTDFARIVDAFDTKGVSFVSVTQAFNTTSSMGRLTLNVLLSFAQFEREVTGERIRDKIAASKKKGLWMGGHVPLGYDARDRTLAINEAEAQTVRRIFARYLALGSVDALKAELDATGVTTKRREHISGRMRGGGPFSRGHLYALLSNPLYIGSIRHKGEVYPGQHPAIIEQSLWQQLQAALTANRRRARGRTSSKNSSLLSGLLFDANGNRLVASHSMKNGQRYRYYLGSIAATARSEVDRRNDDAAARRWRVPAKEIEGAVLAALVMRFEDSAWIDERILHGQATIDNRKMAYSRAGALTARLRSPSLQEQREALRNVVARVDLAPDALTIELVRSCLAASQTQGPDNEQAVSIAKERVPFTLHRRGVETLMIIDGVEPDRAEPDPALIKAIARAHKWWSDLTSGQFDCLRDLAAAYETDERYAARILRLAFLPRAMTLALVTGDAVVDVTLSELLVHQVLSSR